MSADLSLAAILPTIINPILERKGEIIQHEEHVDLKGHRIRLRVQRRAGGFMGTFKCACGECEVSRPRPSIEAALGAAQALAGKHAVQWHKTLSHDAPPLLKYRAQAK